MFKIVDRYIGRNVINMVLLCTLGLVALSSLIKFVDQLRNVGRGEFDTLEAIIFVGYTIPGQFVMFFPLGVLLGTVLALGNLASSSELIVMQSLGKSRLGIVGSACKSIIPLIMVVMLISEFVAPIAEMKSESVFTSAVYNGQLGDAIKILIHKEISNIDSKETKQKIIDDFTDRFGKLNPEILLYIEEKYLESLLKKFNITNILEAKYLTTIIVPEKDSLNIKGDELFITAY